MKLLAHKLKQGVLDEREREEARKRGGASLRRVDADLEAIDSHAVPSEELALAEERVEVWLPRLHRRDPVLRAIAVKKADGFNRREIAATARVARAGSRVRDHADQGNSAKRRIRLKKNLKNLWVFRSDFRPI